MSRNGKPIDTIMVAQLARFGDFLQTTPLLSALKTRHPKAKLTILVSSGQEGLARANPHVDEVLAVNLAGLEAWARHKGVLLSEKFLRMRQGLGFLGRREFDWIINLNTTKVSALLTELAHARRRTGPRLGPDRQRLLPAPWASFIMNLMTHRRLIRFNLVDLLAGYAGTDIRPGDGLTYTLSAHARERAGQLAPVGRNGPLVGFQLGSRHESRQWPPDNFARLAQSLIRTAEAHIVFLGTESERPIGRAVLDHLQRYAPESIDRVTNLMGRTSIEELGGVLAACDLLVTTDTGTMHLAAALKTPILALFMGPAFCHETGPYGAGHVILQARADCSPCYEHQTECTDYPCRRSIRPGTALEAAMWLLTGKAEGSPRIDPPGRDVRVFISEFDDFGITYRPLLPWPLDRTEALALAYREAGRGYMRSGYQVDEAKLDNELHRYSPAADVGRLDLDALLGALHGLAAAGSDPDPQSIRPAIEDFELEPLKKIASDLFKRGESQSVRRLLRDMIAVISAVRRVITGPQSAAAPDRTGLKNKERI